MERIKRMTVVQTASISTFIILLAAYVALFGFNWYILFVGVPISTVLSIIYYKVLKQVDKTELRG
jgi:membrane protein implicated in regulation of membrane protease activity